MRLELHAPSCCITIVGIDGGKRAEKKKKKTNSLHQHRFYMGTEIKCVRLNIEPSNTGPIKNPVPKLRYWNGSTLEWLKYSYVPKLTF